MLLTFPCMAYLDPPIRITEKIAEQDAPSNRKEPLCSTAVIIVTTLTPRSTLALAPSGG